MGFMNRMMGAIANPRATAHVPAAGKVMGGLRSQYNTMAGGAAKAAAPAQDNGVGGWLRRLTGR